MVLALNAQLYLAKYLALFVTKYRQKCRRLRTHLHRQVRLSFHLDLNLDLNLDFYPSLLGALLQSLFETLFPQLFATLFGSMFKSKFAPLYLSMGPALCRQRLGGRRPVGRGVGGRIVVWNGPATTYGMCASGHARRWSFAASHGWVRPFVRRLWSPLSRSHPAASALLPSDFWFLISDFGRPQRLSPGS